jgi:hypothetical protein
MGDGVDHNGSSEQQFADIEIGVRVSGEIGGQSFTGVVRSTGRTGGRSAISADGTFTRIELGTLDSVSVETDNELTTPSGRKLRRAHVTGAEALSSLRVLPKARSVRPVIEHALTVYYDGNTELARTLIDRLIAEQGEES